VIRQGDVCWGELPVPTGSEPGYRRPLVVVQCDTFNRSPITTVMCVVLTSNLALENAPGNLRLAPNETGLARDSVVVASQVVTMDKRDLFEPEGSLPPDLLERLLTGIELALGRR
jgi:mRNA interferase MazF